MNDVVYFANCRCPRCKARMDDVPKTDVTCRHCGAPIDPREVWNTRRYTPIVIPRWVENNAKPVGLILLGAGLSVGFYLVSGGGVLVYFGGISGIGVAWLIFNFFSNDPDS